MKTNALRLAPAVLCLALGACSDLSTTLVCPSTPSPSVILSVVDSESGASVAGEASGFWTTGTVSDSLRHRTEVDGREFLVAYGPPGIYQVAVSRPGQPTWTRSGITVREGTCGPAPQQVTAMMNTL